MHRRRGLGLAAPAEATPGGHLPQAATVPSPTEMLTATTTSLLRRRDSSSSAGRRLRRLQGRNRPLLIESLLCRRHRRCSQRVAVVETESGFDLPSSLVVSGDAADEWKMCWWIEEASD